MGCNNDNKDNSVNNYYYVGVPLPVADVAGVTVEVEDGGHLLALLPGLLDQE